MAAPTHPPANGFVAAMRKLYNPLGFSKGYNFVLWFITDLAFLFFVIFRLEYWSFYGVFCNPNGKPAFSAAPGECYWYLTYRRNNVGIILHLATILPAAFLASLQFMPFIRHRWIIVHRICGYFAIMLALISQASVLMIANHSFGGDPSTRFFVGTAVIATTTALALAYYNVKKLQIDQHRAWMLRAWVWFASIITLRIIMVIAEKIEAAWGGDAITYVAMPCVELAFMYGTNTTKFFDKYPACMPNSTASYTYNGYVAVEASARILDPSNQAAALDTNFGACGWLAFAIHVLAVETYLRLTPRENERLRQVSYERQLERGSKHAGSAGLTIDRLGDSEPWVSARKGHKDSMTETEPSPDSIMQVNT